MGTEVAKVVDILPPPRPIKVHGTICIELMKLVDRVDKIFPEIEAARPRCSSGLKALCLLKNAIEKARLLIQHCSESSKLYLALTGDSILLRFKKSKGLLEQSLSQIQNMVPVMLSAEISQIIDDLEGVTFRLDPTEEEAGNCVKAVLQQYKFKTNSVGKSASEGIIVAVAALKLQITSQKALLIERRSIKKLLNKVSDGDHRKQQILTFLLNLLSEYRKTILDPRVQLTKVQSWETSSNSIDSLSMSMNSLRLPVDFSNMSFGSLDNSQSYVSSHFNSADVKTDDSRRFHSMSATLESVAQNLCELDSLPWESQCNAVEDVKIHVKWDDQSCDMMSSENFVEPLIRFLKKAFELGDVKAQRIGCLLLLEFVSRCRTVPDLNDGAYSLLTSLLNSEVIQEALAIMEVLSGHQYCRSKIAATGTLNSILRILETEVREFQKPAVKILYNLTLNSKLHSLISPLEFLPRLIPFFEDVDLARYCIGVLRNLCDKADARVFIAETSGLISFICKLLENNCSEDQEQALAILLSLCSQSVEHCRLVMDEGVIPDVVGISINGSDKGKAYAMELLQLLRDIDYDDRNAIQELPVSDLDRDLPSSQDFSREQYTKPRKWSSRLLGNFSLFLRSCFASKGNY